MKKNIGFIRDFNRQSRFVCEDDSLFTSTEPLDMDDVEEGRALALLAYIPFFCFIPYIQGKKANSFAYEHGKQGVLLFFFEIIALLGALFWKVALFLAAVVAIVGIIYVMRGRLWKIPWIGSLSEKLDNNFDPDSDSC